MHGYYLEDLQPGMTAVFGKTVTDADILMFAGVSGDTSAGGLARLDWNRDGKEDFAVSHIKSPAALVLNRSEKTGHFLALSLRGITGDRDAI